MQEAFLLTTPYNKEQKHLPRHSEQKAKPKFTCPICKTIFHVCNKDCQKEFWCQHRKEHREQARAVGVGMDNLSSDSAAVTTGKFDGVARTEVGEKNGFSGHWQLSQILGLQEGGEVQHHDLERVQERVQHV